MEKILAGVVVGIFVGALAVEVINRTEPELTRKIGQKAKNCMGALATAFKEGFEGKNDKEETTRPEPSPA